MECGKRIHGNCTTQRVNYFSNSLSSTIRNVFNLRLLLNLTQVMQALYIQLMPMPKKPRERCPICTRETARAGYKYCSNRCQQEYQYRVYIEKWKRGEEKGLNSIGLVSPYIKRHLRRKFKDRCCLCGWSEVNVKTGKVPLVADHIDGNWKNNAEENLRLICPNCDSISFTFAALNKGNGRSDRARSKRAIEGRLLKINMPK